MGDKIDFIFNEAAAKTIKTYRLLKKMSLEDVVKKMKNPVSRQSLYKYENNLARMKNSVFIDICNALNLDAKTAYKRINEFASELEEQEKLTNSIYNKNNNSSVYTSFLNNFDLLTDEDIAIVKTILENRTNKKSN